MKVEAYEVSKTEAGYKVRLIEHQIDEKTREAIENRPVTVCLGVGGTDKATKTSIDVLRHVSDILADTDSSLSEALSWLSAYKLQGAIIGGEESTKRLNDLLAHISSEIICLWGVSDKVDALIDRMYPDDETPEEMEAYLNAHPEEAEKLLGTDN